MQITIGGGEKPRALKAVASKSGLWVPNSSGGVTLIGSDGTTVTSKFRDLHGIFTGDPSTKTPIYEGDTITITF